MLGGKKEKRGLNKESLFFVGVTGCILFVAVVLAKKATARIDDDPHFR